MVGFLMERREDWNLLWWLLLQRFGYRVYEAESAEAATKELPLISRSRRFSPPPTELSPFGFSGILSLLMA